MKDNSEMTKEELIALGWVKNPLDKMQEKTEKQLTAVEWYIKKIKEARQMCDDASMGMDIWHTLDVLIEKGEQAKEMEKEQKAKLWTNEEVFDMLYKTDKFLMIDLREYWKTIEK